MNEVNEILLRRKHRITIEKNPNKHETTAKEKAMVLSIVKNIEAYGFTFSKEVVENLLTYPEDEIEQFYKDLMPKLKKLVGADKEYHPMYPNFPQQVMDASDVELILNAIFHYWTYGEWMPEYEKDERLPLLDDNKITVLLPGTIADNCSIFADLVGSKTNLSPQDVADIEEIARKCPNFADFLPNSIFLKENVALVGKLVLESSPVKDASIIQKYFGTATDVLRFIVALSDGDISLATNTRFRKLKRVERRMVMDLLSGCNNIVEDMFRYENEWIRVGEIVHPGEFKAEKYNEVNNAFKLLRADNKPLMFGGQVHEAIIANDTRKAAMLLFTRPGEFARQLDKLLRDSNENEKDFIIGLFSSIANKVSVPVLLQVRQHFIGRTKEKSPVRIFFPKGNLARAVSIENNLKDIEKKYCDKVISVCENAIIEVFKDKEPLGNVYIDEDFKNYLVPFSQRSASNTSKMVVRGSRIPIRKDANTIRAFVWWTNLDNNMRVDIDLSCGVYDEDWNFIDYVSYTNLRSNKLGIYHSGDITNGGKPDGKGVAEFIDISIDDIVNNKYCKGRYVAFQIYNYTCVTYADMRNCRFGWMEREYPNSGEIFEPKTVEMSMDVNAQSIAAIPVIFDCVERKMIWCDMNLSLPTTYNHIGGVNLESNLQGTTATCYAMANLNKPNLYDLVYLNTKARGIITNDRDNADIIFSNDLTPPRKYKPVTEFEAENISVERLERVDVPIITAYDLDYFMGQLL